VKKIAISITILSVIIFSVFPQNIIDVESILTNMEIADHFGFTQEFQLTIRKYGSELTTYSNIVSSLPGIRISPDQLNSTLNELDLWSPNQYGHNIIIDETVLPILVEYLTNAKTQIDLETVITGRIPEAELRAALDSSYAYFIVVYFDRNTSVLRNISFDDEITIEIGNPAAKPGFDFVVPYKGLETIPASIVDRWEFYKIIEVAE